MEKKGDRYGVKVYHLTNGSDLEIHTDGRNVTLIKPHGQKQSQNSKPNVNIYPGKKTAQVKPTR